MVQLIFVSGVVNSNSWNLFIYRGNSDVSTFKRPMNDGYPKRSSDLEPPARSSR